MESQIPKQRCLWDKGEGCMHSFCRNGPKTPGALREDMEFGAKANSGKNTVQITGENMSAATDQETGGKVVGGLKGQKSEVHTPRQTLC